MLITINLLPSEHKINRIQKKFNQRLKTVGFIITAFVIAISALLYTYTASQQLQLDSLKTNILSQQTQLNKYKSTRADISNISNALVYIDTIDKKSINWEIFLNKFSSIVPEKSQITILKISTVPIPIIDITGHAESRREAIKLYEKMKTTSYFTNTELKTLAKSGNSGQTSFSFTISAKINLEKL